MKTRQLGTNGPVVSEIGIGCTGMTPIYAPPDPDEGIATIHATINRGVSLIDTSDAYPDGNNEKLVCKAIAGIRYPPGGLKRLGL